jgi:hypothetical protein
MPWNQWYSIRSYLKCGAGNIQIARRLRAMIEELALLNRAIAERHMFPEDAALARIPDAQGLGVAGGRTAQKAGNLRGLPTNTCKALPPLEGGGEPSRNLEEPADAGVVLADDCQPPPSAR